MTKKKTLREINANSVHTVDIPPCGNKGCQCAKTRSPANFVAPINPELQGRPRMPGVHRTAAKMSAEASVGGFSRVPGAFERELYEVLEQAGEPTPKQALKALYNHSKRFAKRTLKKVEGKLREIETKTKTKIALLRAAVKARRARV